MTNLKRRSFACYAGGASGYHMMGLYQQNQAYATAGQTIGCGLGFPSRLVSVKAKNKPRNLLDLPAISLFLACFPSFTGWMGFGAANGTPEGGEGGRRGGMTDLGVLGAKEGGKRNNLQRWVSHEKNQEV